MEKYLMMSDVFKSELFIDSDCDDVIVDGLSLTVLESFSGSDAAKFALHAINSHDELVAMNKELLAALEEAKSVLSSINTGRQHKVEVEDDEPAFWQRNEWVTWAKGEILPMIEASIAKAKGGAS